MKRRTLLQWMISAAAVLPYERIRLLAQPRELTPDALAMLREIAPTVLPSSLGPARIGAAVDTFVAWTRGYREHVPLAHGYGHPRLEKTSPSPIPVYIVQLAALEAGARAHGGRWSTIDVEARRALLEAAFTRAGVRALPQRPNGQHVVADLMASYFRSTEANDYCYSAAIQRGVCRPIAVTTKRPAPLGQDDQRRNRGDDVGVDRRVDPRADTQVRPYAVADTHVRRYAVALTVVSEDPHAGS